jgi:hypothetical protein
LIDQSVFSISQWLSAVRRASDHGPRDSVTKIIRGDTHTSSFGITGGNFLGAMDVPILVLYIILSVSRREKETVPTRMDRQAGKRGSDRFQDWWVTCINQILWIGWGDKYGVDRGKGLRRVLKDIREQLDTEWIHAMVPKTSSIPHSCASKHLPNEKHIGYFVASDTLRVPDHAPRG